MVFDSWTIEGAGVAPVNVQALEVLAPSAVALSRSAVPPQRVSSVPVCMWFELSGRAPCDSHLCAMQALCELHVCAMQALCAPHLCAMQALRDAHLKAMQGAL